MCRCYSVHLVYIFICLNWQINVYILHVTRTSQHSQKRHDLRRQYFCALWPWPLTFWPQTKWVFRTRGGIFLFQVWWSQLHRFLRLSCGRTDKQTNKHTNETRNPNHVITVGVGKYGANGISGCIIIVLSRTLKVSTTAVIYGAILVTAECYNISLEYKYVGPPYCGAEIYAGRVACCPWCVTVIMPTGQTDKQTDRSLHYAFR